VGFPVAGQRRVAARLMEIFAPIPRRPTTKVGACSTRSRKSASCTTRSSSGRSATMVPPWRARSAGASTSSRRFKASRRTRHSSSRHIDELGMPKLEPTFPSGGMGGEHAVPVGQAGGLAPGRYAKPARDLMAGPHQGCRGVRTQFHHVIDISTDGPGGSTYGSAVEVNGVKQKPIEGVSMVYSFDDPQAP